MSVLSSVGAATCSASSSRYRIESGPGLTRSHRNAALGFYTTLTTRMKLIFQAAAAAAVRRLLRNGSYTSPLTQR